MGKDRDSNFELLRLILMALIVFHHAITHGLGLDSFAEWSNTTLIVKDCEMNLFLFLNNLTIYAVNTFVIISGYYGIKSSWKKVGNIIAIVLFYTILFTTIPSLVSGEYHYAIRSLLFISHSPYWFIICYLMLMLFAPIINKAFEDIDAKKMKVFTFCIVLISIYLGYIWGGDIDINGYNFFHFLVLYAIGRCISKNWIHFSQKVSISLFILSIFTNTIWAIWLFQTGKFGLVWKTTYYNNPLIMASAIFIVLFVKDFHFQNRWINWISTSSLAIYMFQNTEFISKYFYRTAKDCYINAGGGYNSLIIIIFISLLVCVCAILIDKIRFIFESFFLKHS